MYIPLRVKTDYSLLKSMIKVKDLSSLPLTEIGIVDDNLSYVMEFYNLCLENNIKPIIGLDVKIANQNIYLYAQNENGYYNLIKINNLKEDLTFEDILKYQEDIVIIIPYSSKDLFTKFNSKFKNIYLAYQNEEEKKNALILTKNIVYTNLVLALKEEDLKYLDYLEAILKGTTLEETTSKYKDNYLKLNISKEDETTTINFAKLFNLKLNFNKRYIPKIPNSLERLESLIKKGINKRLNNKVPKEYVDRIKYELSVIKKMGYVDYFLIVQDYVLYAKKNNILVGPGRGSAAGSLISYALGITDIDPMQYNLLFERFLNEERITMPDIDLDFEYDKREQVIDYIKNKYGEDYVALIMTYGTLGSKQVIRDVGKVLEVDETLIDELADMLNPHLTLKDNLNNKVKDLIKNNEELKKLYKVSIKLEGLKKHISTHAAGVVISSEPLKNIIPLTPSGEEILTGFTMEYLEEIGLLKMDVLAVRDLTIITNIKKIIKENLKEDINLFNIPLDDKKTLKLFYDVDTVGIFQFKSQGIMNFLRKLKVTSFADLINAVALFRPGPMDNIDAFIRRRNGEEKIDYIDPSLEPILKETYGIIVYQEQVIMILNKMASYTYAEADIVRRAMSKKKKEVLLKEKEHFINNSLKNGYPKETAIKVFDYIMKFANYGFNKAHSVSYALIGYWMGYLKSNYRVSFIANLLNINIGSELKIKEYIDEAKKHDIKVLKPDINESDLTFKIINYNLLMPLTAIKNIGISGGERIFKERENGQFKDFFDFVARCYGKGVNKKTIESLIDAGSFEKFGFNHQTLTKNIDDAINYAELAKDLDTSLLEKPIMEEFPEYSSKEILTKEITTFGFFLTNHPASKYQTDVIKIKNIPSYFDKYIKTVVLIEKITTIKTKKGEDMAFIDGSDETGTIS
ncbi:MAG TPA: DNA polymerase III subunit alpha, partial [Bacilli bacterium]|nr:DNA polymerase III subunit alpha [Bacilli bacterium]